MKQNFLYGLLGLSFLLLILDAPMQLSIGVKPGDWIKYDRFYFRQVIDPSGMLMNRTESARFSCLIEILNVTGNTITFRESHILDNGSIRWSFTYTADSTKPYFQHPEVAVHNFFLPANLEAGDHIPEPILFGSNLGEISYPPWSQWINKTQMMNVNGVDREVNSIHWIINKSWTGYPVDVMMEERECLFDGETGAVLSFYQNSTISGFDDYWRLHKIVEVHQYSIKDTNLWQKSFWMGREALIALNAIILCVLALYIILALRIQFSKHKI